jgi:hypothetical protein
VTLALASGGESGVTVRNNVPLAEQALAAALDEAGTTGSPAAELPPDGYPGIPAEVGWGWYRRPFGLKIFPSERSRCTH